MGMYTGLRCKIIIKEQYRNMINELVENNLDWSEIAEQYPYDFIEKFSKGFRADFIPRGILSYMPNEWEDVPLDKEGKKDWMRSTATDGFDRQFNKDTGYWSFQCSLKNYEQDIEKFFELILENIAESIIHLEYYHEEWAYSDRYDFVNDKIDIVDTEFKKYGYDYSDKHPWYG